MNYSIVILSEPNTETVKGFTLSDAVYLSARTDIKSHVEPELPFTVTLVGDLDQVEKHFRTMDAALDYVRSLRNVAAEVHQTHVDISAPGYLRFTIQPVTVGPRGGLTWG